MVSVGRLREKQTRRNKKGANLVAGVLITVLGALGIGSHIMRWLPLPIVMGMFGGSILGYVIRLVQATVDDMAVAGVTIAGYLLGRFIGSSRVPPHRPGRGRGRSRSGSDRRRPRLPSTGLFLSVACRR